MECTCTCSLKNTLTNGCIIPSIEIDQLRRKVSEFVFVLFSYVLGLKYRKSHIKINSLVG